MLACQLGECKGMFWLACVELVLKGFKLSLYFFKILFLVFIKVTQGSFLFNQLFVFLVVEL